MWDGIKRLPLEVVEGVEEDAVGGRGVELALLDVDGEHGVVGVRGADERREVVEAGARQHAGDPVHRGVQVPVGEATLVCVHVRTCAVNNANETALIFMFPN